MSIAGKKNWMQRKSDACVSHPAGEQTPQAQAPKLKPTFRATAAPMSINKHLYSQTHRNACVEAVAQVAHVTDAEGKSGLARERGEGQLRTPGASWRGSHLVVVSCSLVKACGDESGNAASKSWNAESHQGVAVVLGWAVC